MYVRVEDDIKQETENSCVKEFKGTKYFFDDKLFAYRFENGKEALKFSENIFELVDLVSVKTKDGIYHYIDMNKNTIDDIVVFFGGKNLDLNSFALYINVRGELKLLKGLRWNFNE